MKNNRGGVDGAVVVFIVALAAIIFIIGYCISLDYGDARIYKDYTVTDKAVKNDGESSRYLVYTKDSKGNVMVFSVEDRLWCGRFDASDDYARIEVGKTYNFETVGKRSHFWSSYPDIIELKEVK